MANLFDSYGLDFLGKDEDTLMGAVRYTVQEKPSKATMTPRTSIYRSALLNSGPAPKRAKTVSLPYPDSIRIAAGRRFGK